MAPDTAFIPAAIRESAPPVGLSQTDLIALLRKPLPSHAIEGGNFRRWAVAVCTAEVTHRDRDYERIERELGLAGDRWLNPNDVTRGQYPHEAHAAAALNWLSHLQMHEQERRTPWFHIGGWRQWKPHERARWLASRRKIWAGFLRAVRNYQQAREGVR